MDKETIIHVIPNLILGGAQTYLFNLIKNVSDRKHEIWILENRVEDCWRDVEYRVVNLLEIYKAIKSDQIVHFHWFPPFRFNLESLQSKRTIVTIQENAYCTIKNANIYIVSTKRGIIYGPRNKTIVIHPSISIEQYYPTHTIKKHGMLIRHSSIYESKISIEDVNEIKSYDLKFSWRIIGKGESNYVRKIESLFNGHNNISFGSSDNIPKELNSAWLYVYHAPKSFEHYGLCIAEALACGLPIITNDQIGGAEQITNNFNGFVCSNYNEMKEKIDYLYNHSYEYDRLRKNISNLNFKKKHNIFVESYRNIYNELK